MMSNVGRETSKKKKKDRMRKVKIFKISIYCPFNLSAVTIERQISSLIFYSIGCITAKLLFLTGKG